MDRSSLELPSDETLRRRFHLVTGKGGVGKSCVALTLGLEFARRGLRTLVCEVGEREEMTRAFGVAPSSSELRELSPSLFTVSVKTQEALTEYGALKFKLKALSQLLSDNPLTRALTALIPGVADLVAFGKAFNHERERDARGLPVWDRVIVDAPSTGHGLTFVRLPQLISEVVPTGNIRREADEMWSLVSDPARTAIHVVTLAEELPTQETLELWRAFERDLEITPQALWINRLITPLEVDSRALRLDESVNDMTLVAHQLLRRRISRHQRAIYAQERALEALGSLESQAAMIPALSVSADVHGESRLTLRELLADELDRRAKEETR